MNYRKGNPSPSIFHITTAEAWRAARASGEYRLSTKGQTLEAVGFIHASYRHQVTGVANAFYCGDHGLVLLVIDPQRLTAELRVEHVADGAEVFPHICGPLNTDAVISVLPFEPAADGTFELPAGA